MNSTATEYLPHDGKGHKKIFNLEPIQDYAPINARDRVIEDNSLALGARLMFVRILDLSTRENVRLHYGAVTISQNKLAHKFNVSLRTIWNWKSQLVSKGVIWMTSQFMPNAWPMDTYHVTELDPRGQTEGRTSVEGMWGNGTRQQRPERIGLGAREPGQAIIPGTGARSNQLRVATDFQPGEKSSFLPTNASPDRNPLPATAETGCHCPPKPVATARRNGLRRGAETSCEPPPKPVAAGSRNPLRRGTEVGCEHRKSKDVVRSNSIVGGAPPDLALEEWIKGLKNRKPQLLPRELQDIKTKLKEDRRKTSGVQARLFICAKIKAVDELMYGPTPPGEPADRQQGPKPTRLVKGPAMSPEQMKRHWVKAAKSLPPGLKQKAAVGTAA